MKRYGHMILVAALAAVVSGCEFTNAPLMIEGAFVNAAFRVDQQGLPSNTQFGTAARVQLSDLMANVDAVADSIKIFNITVTIDSVTGATSSTTAISGSTSIDGNELFSLSNVAISELHQEHSIFDPSVPGCTFNSSGVHYLVGLLRQTPPPDVTVAVLGSAASSSLHFTFHLKIYTQIYTSP